jgi:integrase
MPTPEATLADLLTAVAGTDWPATRKRDCASAIRTAAKALAAEPGDIPLNVKLLRRRLDQVAPESLGVSRLRWNNVRALLNRAIELKAKVMPSAQKGPVSPAWQALAEPLPRASWYRLSALLRFLSVRGVTPTEVTLADLEAFRDAIIENRLRSTPEKTWDGVVWCWNRLVGEVAGWPQVVIPREDKRTVYVLPWVVFPPSLKAEVDAYLKRLAGEVIDEDGPPKAMRPSTLVNRDYQLRSAASALVAAGVATDTICTIGDLARLEPMKLILQQVLNRGDKKHQAGAFNLANALRAAAKYWVKVDEPELAKISRIVAKLSPKSSGLTEKNRRRLMPFNDPDVVQRFLGLPQRLAAQVRGTTHKTVVDAVTAQLAVAIAILQAVPIRIQNLASLDLEEHLVERGNRVYVLIPGEEVKNGRPYQLELPGEVADLIAWYCMDYRDLLVAVPTTALFPGEQGGPKKPSTLGVQITKRLQAYLGLPVNPHLFRHIAAKLYLDRRPGEYALVSRLLNHKSVATTMRAYTGTESVSAALHYQNLVQDLRGAGGKAVARKVAR